MFTDVLIPFMSWLTGGSLNIVIVSNDWVAPTLQTVHILSVAIVLSGVVLINLRVAGVVECGQPIPAVLDRSCGRSRLRSVYWAGLLTPSVGRKSETNKNENT